MTYRGSNLVITAATGLKFFLEPSVRHRVSVPESSYQPENIVSSSANHHQMDASRSLSLIYSTSRLRTFTIESSLPIRYLSTHVISLALSWCAIYSPSTDYSLGVGGVKAFLLALRFKSLIKRFAVQTNGTTGSLQAGAIHPTIAVYITRRGIKLWQWAAAVLKVKDSRLGF